MNTIPDRYSRQILFPGIGSGGQALLRTRTAVIIGLGALGSTSAQLLARAGVGTLCLVDRDFVDGSNLQRQTLYNEDDVRQMLPKAIAASRHLAGVNSDVRLDPFVGEVHTGNVESLIANADVVIDGLDNFHTRALINAACYKRGIPWVHGACVGSYGQVASFQPGKSGCYHCLVPDAGTRTAGFTCDSAGVIGPVAAIVASWQAGEALKIVSGNPDKLSTSLLLLDLWENTVNQVPLPRNPDCPVCGPNRHLLSMPVREQTLHSASLCGRNAVQIRPLQAGVFDFEAVRTRLKSLLSVDDNEFLLKIRAESCELVLFRDGRAIIFGTADGDTARQLYGRYFSVS